MYADFEYYTTEFYGDLVPAESFNKYAMRASAFIDYYTLGKAAKNAALPEVKRACCALAEKYFLIDAANRAAASAALGMGAAGEKASETVGSYSVTYRSGGESIAAALNTEKDIESHLTATARMYLANTGLLYRGGGCC